MKKYLLMILLLVSVSSIYLTYALTEDENLADAPTYNPNDYDPWIPQEWIKEDWTFGE